MNDNFPPLDQIRPEDVIRFWFTEGSQANWFEDNPVFDDLIRSKFLEVWEAACDGRLDLWGDDAGGQLALVIILDQFSRHLCRGTAQAWAQDDKALKIARRSVDEGYDSDLTQEERQFLYMPFVHSEDLRDQYEGLSLMKERVAKSMPVLKAERALELIEKFGRFPDRNDLLERSHSMAELAWLDQQGLLQDD